MKKISLFTSTLILTLSATAAHMTSSSYSDVFMSYFSVDNVKAMMKYIGDHRDISGNPAPLKGMIMWELRGDMPYNDNLSLLAAASSAIKSGAQPMIMGYYSNSDVYTDNLTFAKASYGITGSIDRDSTTGAIVNNPDLDGKIEGLTHFTYAFLEAAPITNPLTHQTNPAPGTLYFNDPWSDLKTWPASEVKNPEYDFCESNPAICYTAYLQQDRTGKTPFAIPTDQKSFNLWVRMGNFDAFSELKHANPNNPLGSLKKIISVGGYGHNITFEDTMSSPTYITNFVNSADNIIAEYKLDGIDLDYENVDMTLAQSQQFKLLVDALSQKLTPEGKEVFVTILSNPAYILGQKDSSTEGFAPGVLSDIAKEVTGISLMTYDFHGAFDYQRGGTGNTGFLSNINQYGTDPFSVVTAVNAASSAGIPADKLSVGIPAYSRALKGIKEENGGLGQAISSADRPRGDADQKNCDDDITILKTDSCSSVFEYNFIQKNMLGKGFTETSWPQYSATTAYAETWTGPTPPPSTSYKLTIQNTGVLGITVSAKAADGKAFGPSDYIGPGTSKDYDGSTSISTKDISGDSNLTITWSIYDKVPHDCSQKLAAFTKDTAIGISVDNDGKATCTIPQAK